jgi:hypothetical protein
MCDDSYVSMALDYEVSVQWLEFDLTTSRDGVQIPSEMVGKWSIT